MTLSKYFKLSMISLIILIICSACQNHRDEGSGKTILTGELQRLSEKSGTLSWEDFNAYFFEDIGSGVYIRQYPLEEENHLIVTGKSLNSPPEQIYMVDRNGKEYSLSQENLNELYDLQ